MAGAKKFNLIKSSGFGIHHADTRNENVQEFYYQLWRATENCEGIYLNLS